MLLEQVRNIFNEECKELINDYTTAELNMIVSRTLEIDGVTNKVALSAIEIIAKECVSGLSIEQINAAKKADQKWLNMSGNAYEVIAQKEINEKLLFSNARVLNPLELRKALKENKVINSEKDLQLINKWLSGRTFDLFIANLTPKGLNVFSVVQCKKSIRERVSRDREPSMLAMRNGFWSILLSLSDDGLGKKEDTKAREMFNGGKHFRGKGWSSAYVENVEVECGIIKNRNRLVEDLLTVSQTYKS